MPNNVTIVDLHQALAKSLPKLLKCSAGVLVTFFIVIECLVVIVALLRSKKFLTRQTQLYLLNVAFVDFLSGVFLVPPLAVLEISKDLWTYSPNFCIYWLTAGSLLLNSRVLSLFILVMDRYLSVCHAMRYSHILTFSRARLSIVLSWCLAALLLLPQMSLFIAKPSVISGNTSAGYLPLDWAHSTSNALRGLLSLMFVLRILCPVSASFVMVVLALKVVLASSKGFQEGFLKVRDPNLSLNIPKEPDNSKDHQPQRTAATVSRKPVLMRIHRGNYMADGTKELFAQLPLTTRAQSARLSRRTAVLPNIGRQTDVAEEKPLQRAQTVYKASLASPRSSISEEGKKNPKTLNVDLSTHVTSIHSSTSDTPEVETRLKVNSLLESKGEPRFGVNRSHSWWQVARSRLALSKAPSNKRRLQDMGSMIPLSFLLLAFLFFSLPYQLLQFIRAIWSTVPLPTDTNSYFYWLACANALINPIVLTFWSTSYRSKILCILSCGRFQPNETAIKRLIIASFGTANLPYGGHVRPKGLLD